MFVIEDEEHCETMGRFDSQELALARLEDLAKVAWDHEPNRAPCTEWRNCERRYVIREYDVSQVPWKLLKRIPVLSVSANGVSWSVPRRPERTPPIP